MCFDLLLGVFTSEVIIGVYDDILRNYYKNVLRVFTKKLCLILYVVGWNFEQSEKIYFVWVVDITVIHKIMLALT